MTWNAQFILTWNAQINGIVKYYHLIKLIQSLEFKCDIKCESELHCYNHIQNTHLILYINENNQKHMTTHTERKEQRERAIKTENHKQMSRHEDEEGQSWNCFHHDSMECYGIQCEPDALNAWLWFALLYSVDKYFGQFVYILE